MQSKQQSTLDIPLEQSSTGARHALDQDAAAYARPDGNPVSKLSKPSADTTTPQREQKTEPTAAIAPLGIGASATQAQILAPNPSEMAESATSASMTGRHNSSLAKHLKRHWTGLWSFVLLLLILALAHYYGTVM